MTIMIGMTIIGMHMERNEVDAGPHAPLLQLFQNFSSPDRQPV